MRSPDPSPPDPRDAREYVRAVERALDVVLAFDADHPSMSLREVADRSGLSRGTAQRYLFTLETLGYIHAASGVFRLAPRVLDLAAAYLGSTTRWGVAETFVEQLTVELNETSSVSVLDGTDIIYVIRRPRRRFVSLALEVGTRLPAWVTSMGRVMLASLPADQRHGMIASSDLTALTNRTITNAARLDEVLDQVSADGFCILDQEIEMGLRSVAVPLHDGSGTVVAALNVTTQVSRTSLPQIRTTVLPALQRTAALIDAAWRHRRDVNSRT